MRPIRAASKTIYIPQRTFSLLSYIRPALLAFILLSLLFLDGGCSPDQLQLAAQQSSAIQAQISTAQQQLKDLEARIATEKAVAATQPATTQAVAQLTKDEEKAKAISDWLDKAKPVVDQLAKATSDVAAGRSPDFSPLSALGPYGIIAALMLSLGYGVYQNYQKQQSAATVNQQAQTIAAQQPVIEHIQEVTGTTNPVAAAAALTSTVPAAPAPAAKQV